MENTLVSMRPLGLSQLLGRQQWIRPHSPLGQFMPTLGQNIQASFLLHSALNQGIAEASLNLADFNTEFQIGSSTDIDPVDTTVDTIVDTNSPSILTQWIHPSLDDSASASPASSSQASSQANAPAAWNELKPLGSPKPVAARPPLTQVSKFLTLQGADQLEPSAIALGTTQVGDRDPSAISKSLNKSLKTPIQTKLQPQILQQKPEQSSPEVQLSTEDEPLRSPTKQILYPQLESQALMPTLPAIQSLVQRQIELETSLQSDVLLNSPATDIPETPTLDPNVVSPESLQMQPDPETHLPQSVDLPQSVESPPERSPSEQLLSPQVQLQIQQSESRLKSQEQESDPASDSAVSTNFSAIDSSSVQLQENPQINKLDPAKPEKPTQENRAAFQPLVSSEPESNPQLLQRQTEPALDPSQESTSLDNETSPAETLAFNLQADQSTLPSSPDSQLQPALETARKSEIIAPSVDGLPEPNAADRTLPSPSITQPESLAQPLPEIPTALIQQQTELDSSIAAAKPPAASLPQSIADPKPPFQNHLTPAQIQKKADPVLEILSPQRSILGRQNPIALSPSILRQSIDTIPEPNSIQETALTQATTPSIAPTLSPAPQSELPTISLAPIQTPEPWSNVADLVRQSVAPIPEPWAEKFRLPLTEEAMSPIAEDSTKPAGITKNGISETLISPLIDPIAASSTSTVSQQQEARSVNEQSLEALAQVVYGLVRDRFVIDKERYSFRIANHPPWIDVISPGFFRSIALTSAAPTSQQSNGTNHPPPRQLEALTQEVYTLIQHRLQRDRERL